MTTTETHPPAAFAYLYAGSEEQLMGRGNTGSDGDPTPSPWPPPKPHPSAPPPPFQTASYSFSVDSMTITNTRSRHQDSDKVSASLAMGNGAATTSVKDLGDLNNGTFPIGLRVGPVQVSDPNIGIAFNYLVVNSGHHDWDTINGVLTKAGGDAAHAGAAAATAAIGSAIGATFGTGAVPIVGSILGAAAGWLVGEVTGLITVDCDGPVAIEQPAFKGIDLWNRTQNPGRNITMTTHHNGLDSPSGCGSNSQYDVSWSITRS